MSTLKELRSLANLGSQNGKQYAIYNLAKQSGSLFNIDFKDVRYRGT